ncbi:hypothetical protein N0V90_007221 [Kalmusia sp. IMI 367209]|nr:hypothetical protein N0V90_007221 [Kalmusia sp. IMI 367209]
MWASAVLPLFAASALAQYSTPSSPSPSSAPTPDDDGKYEISAEGIRGLFIPYGASIANLFINDTNGIERDIVLGFDNASHYSVDPFHPHLGGVPGRYANRIKNSTFNIDGVDYHVEPNENAGADTLHGGPDGWDFRNFTVVAHTADSITFSIVDPDGKEGFPGEVVSYITYTVTPYTWHIKMVALATTKKTPIMLSSHTYWNLDAFANPDTPTTHNHTLHLPYSGQRIGVDNILIPDGTILPNKKYSVNDFWSSPKQLGANLTAPELLGNCGFNCTGYDNAWLVNRAQNGPYDWRTDGPVATLASNFTGIQIDIFTDQDAFQVYSCPGQNGSLPIKSTQGYEGRPRVVEKYGCVVMEVEDWIDGINHPEWGREKKQIFGPGDEPYVLEAKKRPGLPYDRIGDANDWEDLEFVVRAHNQTPFDHELRYSWSKRIDDASGPLLYMSHAMGTAMESIVGPPKMPESLAEAFEEGLKTPNLVKSTVRRTGRQSDPTPQDFILSLFSELPPVSSLPKITSIARPRCKRNAAAAKDRPQKNPLKRLREESGTFDVQPAPPTQEKEARKHSSTGIDIEALPISKNDSFPFHTAPGGRFLRSQWLDRGHVVGLLNRLLTWHNTMSSFYNRFPNPQVVVPSNPVFPYAPTAPTDATLLGLSLLDTRTTPHREIALFHSSEVAHLWYGEVDTFPGDPIQHEGMRYVDMRSRNALGWGRWCFLVVQGHAVPGSPQPPFACAAWHSCMCTETSAWTTVLDAQDGVRETLRKVAAEGLASAEAPRSFFSKEGPCENHWVRSARRDALSLGVEGNYPLFEVQGLDKGVWEDFAFAAAQGGARVVMFRGVW